MENFCLHTNLIPLVPLQKIWLWQSPSNVLEPRYAPTKKQCVGCCLNCPGEGPSGYSPGARWTQSGQQGSANICGDNVRIYACLIKKLDRIHSATLQDEELQKTAIDRNGWPSRTSLLPSLHRCQVRPRMSVWWPLISAEITKTMSTYRFCIANKPTQRWDLLLSTPLTREPLAAHWCWYVWVRETELSQGDWLLL